MEIKECGEDRRPIAYSHAAISLHLNGLLQRLAAYPNSARLLPRRSHFGKSETLIRSMVALGAMKQQKPPEPTNHTPVAAMQISIPAFWASPPHRPCSRMCCSQIMVAVVISLDFLLALHFGSLTLPILLLRTVVAVERVCLLCQCLLVVLVPTTLAVPLQGYPAPRPCILANHLSQ